MTKSTRHRRCQWMDSLSPPRAEKGLNYLSDAGPSRHPPHTEGRRSQEVIGPFSLE